VRVVVTGGAGFIGHHIVAKLLRQGHEVTVIDNLSRPSPRGLATLKQLNVDLLKVDVTDHAAIHEALSRLRPDAVVHAAALIDVAESVEKPHTYMHVNAEGTAAVARAVISAGVGRVIYLSSAAVYGVPQYLPVNEEHPTKPISPYGASKLAGELVLESLAGSLGKPEYVILRLFNVYGPGQNPSSPYSGVITKFIHAVMNGKEIVIYGDGEQSRDFIHVEDVAGAVVKALTATEACTTLNIGTGRRTTINELAKLVMSVAGREVPVKHAPPRKGDIRHSVASVERARRVLGWEPKIELVDGLRTLLDATDTQRE